MRGKGGAAHHHADQRRITPAYAGKSLSPKTKLPLTWDHPRLCGEKPSDIAASRRIQGSPPPMRGKASYIKPILSAPRITPAYAGKSP